MNSQLQLGLIIEGNSTNSEVLRMPSLAGELGPVKSSNLRVARRHSNLIRAGYPVLNYEDLDPAGLILVKIPDTSVARVSEEIANSRLPVRGVSFVLCESWQSAKNMGALLIKGASVATALKLPTITSPWFAVEGEGRAVRQVRRFFSRNGIRSLELTPDHKHLLFASELLAMTVPVSLLISAKELLKESGVSGKLLWNLIDQMARKMVLDASRGLRLEVTEPLAECPIEVRRAYLELLEQTAPGIAEQLRRHVPSIAEFAQPGENG